MHKHQIHSEPLENLMAQLRLLGFHSCYYTLFYQLSPEQQIAPELAEKIDYNRYSARMTSKKLHLFSGDRKAYLFLKIYLQRFAEYDRKFGRGDYFELSEYHSHCQQTRIERAVESGLEAHGIKHEYCLAIEDSFRKGLIGFFWLCSPDIEQPKIDSDLDAMLHQAHKTLVAHHYHELNPWVDYHLFSPTSLEVLKLLSEGFESKEIAEVLYLSPRGVEYHIAVLKQKLMAVNRTNLVAKALRLGVLS